MLLFVVLTVLQKKLCIVFSPTIGAGPYGAVVTHLTCNEKIRGSNPRAGLRQFFSDCTSLQLRLWFLWTCSSFLHLHKTVLNLFSFAGPCFVVICVFGAKKVISLDERTFTHYKMTIFYLCVRKFYVDTNNLPPGTLFVLQIQNSHYKMTSGR